MTRRPSQQTGLVFSAGLARATSQLGMAEIVDELGLSICLVSGSSTGAINAALFAIDPNTWVSRAGQFWEGAAADRRFSSMWRNAARSLSTGSHTRTRSVIAAHLESAFGDYTFDGVRVPLVVTATALDSGAPVEITAGSIAEAVLASVSFPVLTPPAMQGTTSVIDGSFAASVPIAPLTRNNCRSAVVLDAATSQLSTQDVESLRWYEIATLAALHTLGSQAIHDMVVAAEELAVLRVAASKGNPFDFKAPDRMIGIGRAAAADVVAVLPRSLDARAGLLAQPGLHGSTNHD